MTASERARQIRETSNGQHEFHAGQWVHTAGGLVAQVVGYWQSGMLMIDHDQYGRLAVDPERCRPIVSKQS